MKNRFGKSPLSSAALIALSLLWTSPVAFAGAEKAEVHEGTVSAGRGGHATISFESDEPVSIELRGRLVDGASRQPLGNATIEIVRFETEAGDGAVTVEEVMALPASAKSVTRHVTEAEGQFVLSELSPGDYSLQVAWDDVPADSKVVRWELRWVETPVSGHADG